MNPYLVAGGAGTLLQRWDRLGLAVRCGYDTRGPALLHHYLLLSQRVLQLGLVDEVPCLQRTLRLLLQTAGDAALPVCWRRACLAHANGPVFRLQEALALHDPLAAAAWLAAVQHAHQVLRLGTREPGVRP